jgi:hypothetical protein
LDRCGADLLAESPGNIGTPERAGGPAAGASSTVLGALLQERWSTDLITYDDLNDLRALLDGKLVSAAEAKVLELRRPQPG